MIGNLFKSRFGFQPLVGLLLVLLASGGCASNTPTVESSVRPGTEAASQGEQANKAISEAAKININSASIAELDKLELPGTKPSLSERIQGGRPYNTLDDLVSKKVISPEEFKLISELITTGKP